MAENPKKPKKRKPSPTRDKNKEKNSPFRRQKNRASSSKRSNSKGRRQTPKKSKGYRADWVHERINPDNRDIKILKKAIRSLSNSVRRNVNALRDYMAKGGMTPPSLENLIKAGGTQISSAGDNYENLYAEYLKAVEFMNDPTHTPKGASEWQKSAYKEFDEAMPGARERPDHDELVRRYWKAFNRFSDAYPYMFAQPGFATDLIDATEEYCIANFDEVEEMYQFIEDTGKRLYQERMEFFNQFSSWGWD